MRPEDVADAIPCGPDLDRAAEAIREYVDAGFTDVAIVQIGDEGQDRFLAEAAGPLLERLRVSGDAAVLLDIDGTLIDSTYHHAIAWHRAFARHDLHPAVHAIHRTIGMGGDKLVAHVAGDEVEDRVGDALRDAWREEYLPLREEVRPLDGAAELVRELRAAGLRVALASSGDPQFSVEAVDLLGIGVDIEVLTTSDDVDDSKPEPDLLGETLRRMGGVARALLVGRHRLRRRVRQAGGPALRRRAHRRLRSRGAHRRRRRARRRRTLQTCSPPTGRAGSG